MFAKFWRNPLETTRGYCRGPPRHVFLVEAQNECPRKNCFVWRHKLFVSTSFISCEDTNCLSPQVLFLVETQIVCPRKFYFLRRHKLFVSAIFFTSRVSTRKKTCVHTNTKLKNLRMHIVSTKNETCVHAKSGAIKSDPPDSTVWGGCCTFLQK